MLTVTRPWKPSDLRTSLIGHYSSKKANVHTYVPLVDGNMEQPVPTSPTPNDFDMEDATTTAWTAYAGALSKETASPHSGVRHLRITTETPGRVITRQPCLTAGRTYHITGWARSDGYKTPTVNLGAVSWTGTASTDWQYIDFYKAAPDQYLYLADRAADDGYAGYLDFDDFTITDVSAIAWTITAPTNCTVSKRSTDAAIGTQYLHVQKTSGTYAYCQQNTMIVNAFYHITGYLRGDGGTNIPRLMGGNTMYFQGTTSTDWQYFNTYKKQTGSTALCPFVNGADNGYCDFDDITAERVWICDGDSEDTGVTYWTAANGATLTKDAGVKYSGTQSLKIAGAVGGGAKQNTLTANTVYRLTCAVHPAGDSVNQIIIVSDADYLFTSTTADEWQLVDIIFKTGATTDISFYITDNCGWVDNIVIEPAYINDGDMEKTNAAVTYTNGDFEAGGSPPTGWLALDATVTTEAGTRTGGTGSYVAQIYYDGYADGYMYKDCIEAGKVYTFDGWARSTNECSIPRVAVDGLGDIWTGTDSSEWQHINVTFLAIIDSPIYLLSRNLEDLMSVQFDDTSITDVSATAYTAYQAVVSKQTTDPYSGTYVLRVAFNGTNASGCAYQTTLTIGQSYNIQGVARGDGTSNPSIKTNDGTTLWTGTSSTSWQSFNVNFVAANATIDFYGNSLSATHYVEFDSITISNISCPALIDLSGNTRDAIQATVTKQPMWLEDGYNNRDIIRFDGTDDFLQAKFPIDQPTHRFIVTKWSNNAAGKYITDGGFGSTDYGGIYRPAGSNAVSLYAPAGSCTTTIPANDWVVLEDQLNGASSAMSCNGGTLNTGNVGTRSPFGITIAAAGFGNYNAVADIGEVVLVKRILSSLDRKRAITYFKRKFNLNF